MVIPETVQDAEPLHGHANPANVVFGVFQSLNLADRFHLVRQRAIKHEVLAIANRAIQRVPLQVRRLFMDDAGRFERQRGGGAGVPIAGAKPLRQTLSTLPQSDFSPAKIWE